MNKNAWIVGVVAALVFGGGGFYAGMKYQQGQRPAFGGNFTGAAGGAGNFAGRGAGAARAGGGAAFGTIIAKDASSITIQLATGTTTASGSKIVLYDSSTQVGKMVSGSPADLSVGTSVTVAGTANSDGSITAQTIQIRPAGTTPRGGGQ